VPRPSPESVTTGGTAPEVDIRGTVPAGHSWRTWVEPWYLSYLLLGTAIAGLAPILLPLAVSQSGSPTEIGLVVAAFSLGGLLSPLWGVLADRYRLHRWLLAIGLLATALALAAFPLAMSFALRIFLALIMGTGASAAATVANLFVVEVHPADEWDRRIGWLQAFYGGGQVVGLLLAGLFSQTGLAFGFWAGAILSGSAFLIGWITTGMPPPAPSSRPLVRNPVRHVELAPISPQRQYHHVSSGTLSRTVRALGSPLARFLLAWFCGYTGAAAFFALYPVIMQQTYRVAPAISSTAFAFAAAVGFALYAPAGVWSDRIGTRKVLLYSLAVRLIAFLGLFGLSVVREGDVGFLALLVFLLIVFAWSLISVSGTALTAELSPLGKGEGLGIFNAATALASVVGSIAGGWIAQRWGYGTIPLLGVAGIALAVIFLKPSVSPQT
jgi:DHA1 family tetracycline resistance protein-like MFS transporter